MARILLTGATGYVGGRLRTELEQRGVRLRCLVRRPESLLGVAAPGTEIVGGDAADAAAAARAVAGIDTAYYLIHAMGSTEDFAARDRETARVFSAAAREAGVRRIIYLGGLGESSSGLSAHLASRQETGAVLRASGVPVIELRASIIIGSGSLSFEMVRALVERLPIMICPRWVAVPTQPIAVEDVIAYLVAALDLPPGKERVYELGGPERVTYGDLMREYARQRGLRRFLIPIPLLTPRLSSLWLGLVTPLYARVGRKLVDSLRNPTVVRDPSALADFPIRPRGVREAIARALVNEDREFAETRWSDAVSSSGLAEKYGGQLRGTRFVDTRAVRVATTPDRAFDPILRIGGRRGWYYGNFLWRLRGALDLAVGGVGLRRGRRLPDRLRPGDAVDFWRVDAYEPNRLLRLRAEMKLPGKAWLEFSAKRGDDGRTRFTQTAFFEPRGLFGFLYWYAVTPFHHVLFNRMATEIAHRAEMIKAA